MDRSLERKERQERKWFFDHEKVERRKAAEKLGTVLTASSMEDEYESRVRGLE